MSLGAASSSDFFGRMTSSSGPATEGSQVGPASSTRRGLNLVPRFGTWHPSSKILLTLRWLCRRLALRNDPFHALIAPLCIQPKQSPRCRASRTAPAKPIANPVRVRDGAPPSRGIPSGNWRTAPLPLPPTTVEVYSMRTTGKPLSVLPSMPSHAGRARCARRVVSWNGRTGTYKNEQSFLFVQPDSHSRMRRGTVRLRVRWRKEADRDVRERGEAAGALRVEESVRAAIAVIAAQIAEG